jgi:uncharacterized protein (TIGR02145 family)
MMKLWSIILFAILLVSCTDYVNQIEDERDEWRTTREQAALLSSSEIVGLSSSIELKYSSSVVLSGDSHEESSSSDTKSCSSEKLSSSSKDGEPIDVSSSSSVNSKNSSSSAISSSDGSEETSSSSSVILSGDSHEESSSSENVKSSSSGKASWAYLNPAISYGEMIDNRDGQVYKTVVIGEQTWMAENLNFAIEKSLCYECDVYGRLYTWSLAMDSAGIYSDDGKGCTSSLEKTCTPKYPVRGICPENWHLPDSNELSILKEETSQGDLKSKRGWYVDAKTNSNGQDNYGFSGVAVGYWVPSSNTYGSKSNLAAFWSSSENVSVQNRFNAYSMQLAQNNVNSTHIGGGPKTYGYSVRCLKNSSNTVPVSSSSAIAEVSSSSMGVVPPCKTTTEDNCEYGELIDVRDGQVYKTVKIGSQWWMAENLRFETEKSVCYEDGCSKYGEYRKYGQYYLWSDAMDSAGVYSSNGKGCGYKVDCAPHYPVRGICPDGWHIPDTTALNELFFAVGGKSTAGKQLKSSMDWVATPTVCGNGNGSDSYGFTLWPSGYQTDMGQFSTGNYATFWSSIPNNSLNHAYHTAFGSCVQYGSTPFSPETKNYKMTVRCIKD